MATTIKDPTCSTLFDHLDPSPLFSLESVKGKDGKSRVTSLNCHALCHRYEDQCSTLDFTYCNRLIMGVTWSYRIYPDLMKMDVHMIGSIPTVEIKIIL